MDFPTQIMETLILAFFLLYGALSISAYLKSTRSKPTAKLAPQPSGALPVIGHLHMLRGKDPIALTLGAIADKHGPIFSLKLGQHQMLVLSAWEQVKECLTTNDRLFATRASTAGGKYLGYNHAAFAIAPYGQYWRDVRKLATVELLSARRVQMLSHVIASEVDSFIKNLFSLSSTTSSSASPSPVHMSELLEHLTFNINVRLIAGKRFSSSDYKEENNDACRFEHAIKEALRLFGVFVWSDALPCFEWLDSSFGHVSSMKKCFKKLDDVLERWLQEHRQERSEGKKNRVETDLMDVMISYFQEDLARISGHSLDSIIKSTSLILTLTGSESTSVTITWTLSLLLNHPKVLKTAQEELDTHIGKDRWAQDSDLSNLKYLQAILKESLRLYPPGPITGVREATEDCHVGGYFVPKGTRLLVNIWKLQRDPRMWANPTEFQPERFLTNYANMEFKSQTNFEYLPFSSGRRSCPGATLGLHVVQLVLARLIQGFDMGRVGSDPVDMREGLGLALPKANPLEVVLAPRLPFELYQCL